MMVKRRMKVAGLPARLSPHSFQVATITDLLNQGVPLEEVQANMVEAAELWLAATHDQRREEAVRGMSG
jgi:integrase/recombinase XerD